jgi:hypothetical protein
MDREREKLRLEQQLVQYQELARYFPDGSTNETILDLIAELREQIRSLEKE